MFKYLCLLFILQIRYPANKPISATIRRKFGHGGLLEFRKVEDTSRKLSKAKLGLHFLTCCKAYDIFPDFLKPKLYRNDLYNNELYHDFKLKLLNFEIEDKLKRIKHLENALRDFKTTLRNITTFIDYECLNFYIQKNVKKTEEKNKESQRKKIEVLGGRLELRKCESKSVVFNYSDRVLTNREVFLLSLGLDFRLPVYKPNFYKYYLYFENFISTLKRCKIAEGKSFSDLCEFIKFKAKECFRNHRSRKIFSPLICKDDLTILKELGSDKTIKIFKPDKGRGTVIMNVQEYNRKISAILSDFTKFEKVSLDPFSLALRVEDKVNRFLMKLKKFGMITEMIYKNLHVTGSSPGVLYGLARIHKNGIPLRPILAAYNTASFSLSKFLIPLIDHLSSNSYTIRNAYDFVNQIKNLNIDQETYMVSFDISSLYTNVPVSETLEIIINKLFIGVDAMYLGYSKKLFYEMLNLAVSNTYFFSMVFCINRRKDSLWETPWPLL